MDGAAMKSNIAGGVADATNSGISAPQVPLAFVPAGQVAKIIKIRGNDQMHHHLENLGFVEGAQVTVVCENAGNLIVEVKGAQVALDRQVSMKIVTSS